ncbi:MAG: DUF4160 domain-containing protein [Amaricoccus sp.]|uniref:DUF4160 domain-containing protein n=1 Tax=Amaricoccus sp. TaxID=1872485 RepID=UPI0039E6A1D9
MPTIFRYDGFRFFFYSNEGDPREPMHVHVLKDGCEVKVWLDPEVSVAASRGFDARTIQRLRAVVIERRAVIERAWFEYFG